MNIPFSYCIDVKKIIGLAFYVHFRYTPGQVHHVHHVHLMGVKMRVKIFCENSVEQLETLINKWLDENEWVKIHFVKQTESIISDTVWTTMSVFYVNDNLLEDLAVEPGVAV